MQLAEAVFVPVTAPCTTFRDGRGRHTQPRDQVEKDLTSAVIEVDVCPAMSAEPQQPEATMDATAKLQTYTLNDGPSVTTTYTRADLGINTAIVASTPDGQWVARLCYGPEADEYATRTVDLESTADRLAVRHSASF